MLLDSSLSVLSAQSKTEVPKIIIAFAFISHELYMYNLIFQQNAICY